MSIKFSEDLGSFFGVLSYTLILTRNSEEKGMKNSKNVKGRKSSSKRKKKHQKGSTRLSVLARIQLIRMEIKSIQCEHTLIDTFPILTCLEGKYGLTTKFSSGDVSYVGMDVIDFETKEKEHFQMYIGHLIEISNSFSNVGAIHSYFKKMLYQNIYNIYEVDDIDSERELIIIKLKNLIDEDGITDLANKMHVDDLMELNVKTLKELLGAVENNEKQKK